jgi:uncharacterized membrane protein YoaK (UPF0700 family)
VAITEAAAPAGTASLRFALLVTGTTGFVDAYTFLERGGVFANAQTGNVVIGAVALSEGRWEQAVQHAASILTFAAGVGLASYLAARERPRWAPRVEELATGLAAAALLAAAFVPSTVHPLFVLVPLTFLSAMQLELFRSLGGLTYMPIATSGNLMRWVESGREHLSAPDPGTRHRFGVYCGIVGVFVGGALAGALLSEALGVAAAAFGAAAMVAALLVGARHR